MFTVLVVDGDEPPGWKEKLMMWMNLHLYTTTKRSSAGQMNCEINP